jgi:hypothetical protein
MERAKYRVCNRPIAVFIAAWQSEGLKRYSRVHAVEHPPGSKTSLALILFNGVLKKLQILNSILQGDVVWFVFCIERFDRSYAAQVMHDHERKLSKAPARRESQ